MDGRVVSLVTVAVLLTLLAVSTAAPSADATKSALPAGASLLLIGDSLGVGIEKPIASISNLSITSIAHVSFNAHQTLQAFLGDASIRGDAVVASLGSNDAAGNMPTSEAADVQAIVDLAFSRGATRFVWIMPPNFSLATPPAPATTEKQRTFAALWSDPRVEVLVASPAALGSDHIHLTPAGYAKLASQVDALLTLLAPR